MGFGTFLRAIGAQLMPGGGTYRSTYDDEEKKRRQAQAQAQRAAQTRTVANTPSNRGNYYSGGIYAQAQQRQNPEYNKPKLEERQKPQQKINILNLLGDNELKPPVPAPSTDPRNLFSKAFDQVNIFDNNRTFKQATPTQTKSAFQQAGQFGGQTARGVTTVIPQTANSLAEGTGDTIDLARVALADQTGNIQAKRAALDRGLRSKYSAKGQGLLGTGGLISNEEAQKPMSAGDLTKKVAVKGPLGATEVLSLITGGFAAKGIMEEGLKRGFTSQAKTLAGNYLLNTAQGGLQAVDEGKSGKDIIKQAAISGPLGTVTDVAVGGAGVLASKVVPKSKLTKLVNSNNQDEVSKIVGREVSPEVAQVIASTKDENLIKAALEVDNEPAFLRKDPATIEEARAQRERGVVRDMAAKEKSPAQLDYEAKRAIMRSPDPLDVPSFMRQGEKAIKEHLTARVAAGEVIDNDSYLTQFKKLSKSYDKEVAKTEGLPEPKRNAVMQDIDSRYSKQLQDLDNNAQTTAIMKNLTPDEKQSLDTIAKSLGHKDVDALIKATEQPQVASNISKVTPEEVTSQLKDAILDNGGDGFKTSKLGKLAETLSIGRQTRKITKPIENFINTLFRGSLESGSRTVRTPGRLAVGISKQAGKTPEELARLASYQGQRELGDVLAKEIADSGRAVVKTGVRPDAVWGALDPELLKATGGKLANLSPEETAVANKLRGILDLTHEGEHSLGLIDDATYKANKGGYMPRDFTSYFVDDANRHIARQYGLETNIFKSRKDLGDIPKEVIDKAEKDPFYMTSLRVQQYQRNKAFVEMSNWIANNGSVLDAPKKGYIQVPESKVYGELSGKYVLKEQLEDIQGFIYETTTAQHTMALLNAYDRFGPRRARKALVTVYNPGVRLGNRTFNYLTSSLNGINPITFTKNWKRADSFMKKKTSEYVEAAEQGIFGSNIIDKELYRADPLKSGGNIVSKGHNIAKESYGAVDDKAKLAAYTTFRERGLSPQEAAQRTNRFSQNYDMVGHFFDQGAKTPLVGNAFVRFSSELMRVAANTAIDNPIRAAGAVIAGATIVSLMSQASGESPEDRKTREGRLGAPRIPFTNQSLEVQTPWGAINAGRLIGITTYNDLYNGAASDAKRFLPWQIPIRKGENGIEFNSEAAASDPLLGPIVSLMANKDFRGKSISDPDAAKYPNQPLSSEEQNKNRLNFLKMSYLPLANETDSIVSASQSKENYYGQKRSVPQAVLRSLGIKIEQYGHDKAQKARDTEDYFSGEYARAQDFLKQNPDLKESYNKFKGREKVRSGADKGKSYDNLVSPERWKLVSADQTGRLYNFLRDEAVKSNQKDSKPIDPIFQLPTPEQQKQVLELRSRPTGDDIETEEILRATQPWYTKFEQAERDYYKANTEYYKGKNIPDTQGSRMKAYSNVKYPEQTNLIKEYYKVKGADAEAGKQFFKNNADTLSEQFKQYRKERLNYINAKRKIEGFPPIDENVFNNVTFGYEDDERKVYDQLRYKYGYGYGYGSKDPSKAWSINLQTNKINLPDLTNFLGNSAKGGFSETPKLKVKAPKTVMPALGNPKKLRISSLTLPSKAPKFK